jgi:predicted aldo/keto reductase-like oxidoreductase
VKLGPALKPYRDKVFLACKSGERTAEGARREFEQSCEQLQTDHFDLYQLHAITEVAKDVDVAFAAGGVMEFVDQMKREGRIRHAGFSAHGVDAAIQAMDRYDFDSALFPVNYFAWRKEGWGRRIMEHAQERGVACLALKAMALGKWQEGDPKRNQFPKCWYEPIAERELAELALRWTLSQPVTAAIPPGMWEQFQWAMDVAADLRPLAPEELQVLESRADEVHAAVFP